MHNITTLIIISPFQACYQGIKFNLYFQRAQDKQQKNDQNSSARKITR